MLGSVFDLMAAVFPDGAAMAFGEVNRLVLDANLLCEFNLFVDLAREGGVRAGEEFAVGVADEF